MSKPRHQWTIKILPNNLRCRLFGLFISSATSKFDYLHTSSNRNTQESRCHCILANPLSGPLVHHSYLCPLAIYRSLVSSALKGPALNHDTICPVLLERISSSETTPICSEDEPILITHLFFADKTPTNAHKLLIPFTCGQVNHIFYYISEGSRNQLA